MKNKTSNFLLLMLVITCVVTAQDNKSNLNKAQGGTGFKINDIRTFESSENTVYKEDGELIPELRAQGGTGYKIRYKGSEVNQNATLGVLDEVELINIYKGPVVANSPLKIFNIDSLVNSQTFIENLSSTASINLGDEVKVSGFIDSASSAIITRIEKVDSLTEWKLTGYPSFITANQFQINQQLINYTSTQVFDCDGSLNENSMVEVIASVQANFDVNSTLQTVISVTCINETFDDAQSKIIIEGMVDEILADDLFILSGLQVSTLNNTRYIKGRADDLQERIKVEIEGELGPLGMEFVADKIRFLEPRFNLVIPLSPIDIADSSINIAGVSLIIPPQLLDDENLLAQGINETTQVKLRGYDQVRELFLTRINSSGNVDFDNVNGNGLVTAVNQPVIQLFGVDIDTTDGVFFDSDGQSITRSEFFNRVQVGSEVEFERSSLDQVSDMIFAGEFTIIETGDEASINKSGKGISVLGVGTLTSRIDLVFESSFE